MARKAQKRDERSARKSRGAVQPRRKSGRRGKHTLHYIILLILVLAAGVVLSLTVFFKIEAIEVIGVDRYEPDEIISASGVRPGDNLLRLSPAKIEERILEEFPYIKSVKAERKFPPKVELVVTQNKPDGAVIEGGEVALITLDGKLLERGDLLVSPELPIFTGIALSDFRPGDMLGGENSPENQERLTMLNYLFEAAGKSGNFPITNVDVTDRLNMKMVYDARLLLELGSESDIEYKITFLNEVISSLEPDAQAKLDASNVKDKRILVKWGKVENGVFYPQNANIADKIVFGPDSGQALRNR